MIGKTISHYKILEKLGEGGMGVVYKAEDTTLKRTVALKFLPFGMTRDPEANERFLHEAQAAAALSHPGICTVFEIGEADDQSFIAMECVEGRSLSEELKAAALRPERAIELGIQIGEALREAHVKGIVHRDIKPANIMIDPSGRAKIMDFGLARLAGSTLLTRAGTTLGTAAYMSPEQALGIPVDERADIWALGVVLYEMLTGRRPFEGDDARAVMYSVLNDDPPPPSTVNEALPIELDNIVAKALAKDRDHRYQSTEAMLGDLTALARGEHVTVTLPPARRRVPVSRLTERWAGWLTLVAIAALAMIAVHSWMARRASTEPDGVPRVLVTAFENRTGDPARDPLGQQFAEHIVEGITKMEMLEVVPTVGVTGDPSGARADYIVSGSYGAQGEGLAFHAEVGDAERNRAVYVITAAADSAEDEAHAMNLVRSRVMGGLAMEVQPPTYGYDRTRPPLYEAYSEQILGQSAWGRGNIAEAVGHYERAAEIDSTFLPPLIALTFPFAGAARADSLVQSLLARRNEWSPTENLWIDYRAADLRGDLRVMMRCLRELIVTDPGHPGIRSEAMHTAISLGRPREATEHFEALDYERLAAEVGPLAKAEFVYWGVQAYHLLGEDDHALRLAQEAIEESPEDEGLRRMQIAALAALGRTQDLAAAIDDWFQVATQVDMYTPVYAMHHVIGELRTHGYAEEAAELAHRIVRWYGSQDADDVSVRARKAIALYCAEEWEEAAALLVQLLLELPESETIRGTLAAIAARRGDREEALRVLGERPEGDAPWVAGGNALWQARIAALLGEQQRAVDLLKTAIAEGALVVPAQAHYHMDFEPLRDYPPFQEFVRPKG
jgi:serine/threonine protein kinase/tetratricopeptide (TPR) repeat protein